MNHLKRNSLQLLVQRLSSKVQILPQSFCVIILFFPSPCFFFFFSFKLRSLCHRVISFHKSYIAMPTSYWRKFAVFASSLSIYTEVVKMHHGFMFTCIKTIHFKQISFWHSKVHSFVHNYLDQISSLWKIKLLRTEMLYIGTLLCKSCKIGNICYDHRSPVFTLDNDDALTE